MSTTYHSLQGLRANDREYLARLNRERLEGLEGCESSDYVTPAKFVPTLQGAWLARLVTNEWNDYHSFQRLARLARLEVVEPDESAIVTMYARRDERVARRGHLTSYDLLETLYLRYRDESREYGATMAHEPHNEGRGTKDSRLLVNGTETRASSRWNATSRKRRQSLKRRDGSPFVTACKSSHDGGRTWNDFTPASEGDDVTATRKPQAVKVADARSARLRAIAGTIRMADQD